MQIDKNMIIDMLRQRGDHAQADQAQQEMPNKVDPQQDAGMLSKFGINPQEIMSMFSGGSGDNSSGGGMGGMLGDMAKKFK